MRKTSLIYMLSFLVAACGDGQEAIRPQRMDLTEAVYASGNVYPHDEYKVSATADGILTERKVDPGDTISTGTLLFRIESEVQDVRYAAAERIYQTARENYSEGSPALAEATLARRSAYDK